MRKPAPTASIVHPSTPASGLPPELIARFKTPLPTDYDPHNPDYELWVIGKNLLYKTLSYITHYGHIMLARDGIYQKEDPRLPSHEHASSL
jgi:hypothetical protein